MSDADYETLKQRMLAVAGQAVCLHREIDLKELLARARFSRGYNARMMVGEPIRCHANSAALWDANRNKLRLVTGYGLTRDGMWRQHSWCIDQDDRVVETTVKRLLYYGFILNRDEANLFHLNNL
jgi:hypothetical protein